MRLTRFKFGFLFACQLAFSSNLQGQGLYFDPDASTAGNSASTGASLGGSGTWDTTTANWWNQTSLVAWPNTTADQAIFTGPFVTLPIPGVPVPSAVSVAGPVNANRLSFLRSGYTLSGSTITLGGTIPSIGVNLGESVTIGSQLSGTSGLVLNGGGTLRLTNSANNYTGTTTLSNGSLIITSQAQLGTDSSTVVVARQNPYPGSTATVGFGGGSLVLDGTGGAINFTRNLSLQARGPIGDRGSALQSIGNNTISGNINAAVALSPAVGLNTRINSVMGNLTFAGGLDATGTAGTTFTILGGLNTAGMNNFTIAGPLTGTGTIEKTGSGTLFLNPSATSGFSGRIRVSGSAAVGQSSVRISSATVGANSVFGTEAAPSTPMTFPLPGTIPAGAGSNSTIDMNGGILEVRANANQTFANNVYARTGSTFFADRAAGGLAVGGTVTFGNLHSVSNVTNSFNSRNGYGMTFGAQTLENVANGNNTFTNGLAGLLTFNGDVWNSTDTTARTLSIGGNGNTRITGGINSSGTGLKTLNKDGTGNLTILGVSTLDGPVNINAGGLTITDFRSLNNTNTSAINIGTGGTAGALIIGGGGTPTAAGLTTNKVITLGSTTGAPSIYANQTGSDGVVINTIGAAATVGAGSKTLNLAGTSTANNIINGVISDNSATNITSILKHGSGTWALGGANTFTGTTTIANGTLKLQASTAVPTVLGATNDITFAANNSYAGGTLEFAGQAGASSVQALDVLTLTSGANTIRLTPGAGGTASLSFASLATSAGGTVNIVGADAVNNRFSVGTTANGLVGRTVYFNGADFATRTLGVYRAPVYGTDATFVNLNANPGSSATNNYEVTGDFTAASGQLANTLKLNGPQTFTVTDTLTMSTGGILATGGTSTITGGTVVMGAQVLVPRVNLSTDLLTIDSVITGTAGLMKTGAGTLVLSGASSARTGTTTISEGTLRLSGAAVLSAPNVNFDARQGTTFDLNGVSTGTSIGSYNNNGTVTNSNAGPATLTIGNGTGTGTSFGSINETAGVINLTKTGTGSPINFFGTSNYTGVTTIGGGLLAVDTLANIGTASGIGSGNVGANAASLVFENGGGLDYRGATLDGILTLGARSASTDRLFTMNGTTATLSSAAANNNSVAWTNPGAIVFGGAAPRTLTLTGGSQGENTLTAQLTDAGGAFGVSKTGTGVWRLAGTNNTYSGPTVLNSGFLLASDSPGAQGLSPNSNLTLSGGSLYSQGTISRAFGTGGGQMQFAPGVSNVASFSGFTGGDSKLTVNFLGSPTWGSTPGFLGAADGLILNGSHSGFAAGAVGSIALSEVEIAGDFDLGSAIAAAQSGVTATTASGSSGVTLTQTTTSPTLPPSLAVGQIVTGTNIPAATYITSINTVVSSGSPTVTTTTTFTMSANAGGAAGTINVAASPFRAIRVDDNGNTGADYARISGAISGGAGIGIRKVGGGQLLLSSNSSSYNGETNVFQGTLGVTSLGNSAVIGGTSSVGTTTNANLNSNAITLGNGDTGGAILQYLGAGETSDRKIRFNSTTGGPQLHADGTGALILTNVANDMGLGIKTLNLRGTNAAGNMITSVLADNGGALAITVDGSANWILSGANTYTGITTPSTGALGIGNNAALGGSVLQLTNGNVYAYGADRTITNVVNQTDNTSIGFQGDYSLAFNALANQSAGNSTSMNNNIVAGKSLTFAGINANSLTGNRNWTLDGSGTTIVNGNLTTTTAFGLNIIKTGDGVLLLNGAGGTATSSNYNQNNANTDIDRGTLRAGAVDVIPSFGAATPTTTAVVTASAVIPVSSTTGLKVGQLFTGTGVTAGTRILSIDSPTQFTATSAQTIPTSGTSLAFTISGALTISPELAQSDVATFDLNGFSQSINALTNTTDGTAIIDNSQAAPVTLTVGNNNAAVSFGNGTNNAITNSGGGALSLTKVGTGTATIGGNSTFTGVTTITSGAVTITNNNSLGSTVANTVINSNGTTTTGGTLSLGVSATPGIGITTGENFLIQGTGDGGTFATALGGVGGVIHNINGVVTLNSTQSFRLGSSGAGTVTNFGLIQRSGAAGGGIVFNGATGAILNVNQAIDNNLGSITVHAGGTTSLNASLNDIGDALVQNSSTLQTTADDALGLNRSLTLGQGALVNGATGLNNDVATFRFNATSQTIGALNAFANAGTLPNNATATGSRLITSTTAGAKLLTVGNGNGSGGFDGVISNGTGGGTLAFTKVGTGTQSFLGTIANTYTGDTTINGGILALGKTAGVNAIAGNVVIGNGAGGLDIVRLDGSDQIADTSSVSFNGSGADAGVLRLNAFNESVAGISSTAGAGIVENGGATASVFTTSFASGIQTFTGVIQDGGAGALSLTKAGAGTQIISGANTFSGGTVVNGGLLLANSSGALGTGGVTVNGGALGGTGGVIAGGVTLAGGTLAPGSSIGTLTVGSVAGAGTLGVEYDSTTQGIDLLTVTGELNINSIALSFTDFANPSLPGPLTQPAYVFATYGTLTGSNFSSVVGLPVGYEVSYNYLSLNQIALVTAVPEPGTLALLTVAIVGGGLYRRRRHAKKTTVQS